MQKKWIVTLTVVSGLITIIWFVFTFILRINWIGDLFPPQKMFRGRSVPLGIISTQEMPKSGEAHTPFSKIVDKLPSVPMSVHPEKTIVQSTFAREMWKEKYFKPVNKGTYHVFVKSLEPCDNFKEACSVKAIYSSKYPDYYFRVMPTVATDGISNKRYAICLGNGLSEVEADTVVAVAKREGIALDAFKITQPWDTADSGLVDISSSQEKENER